MLVLLYLSAAFDTVYHQILFSRLERCLGITGTALTWIKSYLTGRSQAVSVNDILSEKQQLPFGLPQGSVLGPLLFVAYTLPLGDVARSHGISFHLYADDTQLYVSLDTKDRQNNNHTIRKLETCLTDIKRWMCANKLKLNDDKTDLIIVSSPYYKSIGNDISIHIGDIDVTPSKHTRNLGVMFDSFMAMDAHINTICKACYLQLQHIRKMKPLLNQDALCTVVHAFISSRLDYCNSLLVEVPEVHIQRLQRIQNIAARIITGSKKQDHITPVPKYSTGCRSDR